MLRPSRRSDALVLGDHVGTPQLVELDPVLERAQERVGVVQRLAVLAADVRRLGSARRARSASSAARIRLVGAAVHELQQLDRELDVAQPAGAELELPLGLVGRDVLDDPAAHRLGVLDEAVPLDRAPHHRLDHLDVLPAQLEVAGDRHGP